MTAEPVAEADAEYPLYADPKDLAPAGRTLFDHYLEGEPEMEPARQVELLEICRMKDRLDQCDRLLKDPAAWLEIVDGRTEVVLVIDKLAALSVSIQSNLRQMVAAAKLPDATGIPVGRAARRPNGTTQRRDDGSDGYKNPKNVSSLQRAQRRAS